VIGLLDGVRVYLMAGRTDLRRGIDGLAAQIQTVLREDLPSAAISSGVKQIAALYQIERRIYGLVPAERLAVRRSEAVPLLDALRVWLTERLGQVAPRGDWPRRSATLPHDPIMSQSPAMGKSFACPRPGSYAREADHKGVFVAGLLFSHHQRRCLCGTTHQHSADLRTLRYCNVSCTQVRNAVSGHLQRLPEEVSTPQS
jgi:hypothetical protein